MIRALAPDGEPAQGHETQLDSSGTPKSKRPAPFRQILVAAIRANFRE